MDKRALRKHINPKLHFNLNNGLFCTERINYIVRTAVKNISGHRILILYFYLTENILEGNYTPIWTVFQSSNEYLTYSNTGATRWRTCMFCNLDRSYYFISHCAFYSVADEKRITKFCKIENKRGFDSLYKFQSNLFNEKAKQNRINKQKKIAQKMKLLPSLPRDLNSFIMHEAMPQYIFYDYHKNKKTHKGYCTACKHEVNITGIKHNATGVCPHCQKTVTFKSRGKRGNISDRTTVQIIQRTKDDGLVIRIVKAYCEYWKSDTPTLNVYENARSFISWDNTGIKKIEPYYYSYSNYEVTNWHNGNRPYVRRWYISFEADTCGFLYHKNLDKAFNGTPWMYCALKEYYSADPTPLSVEFYLRRYLQYPMLEYLVKLCLYRLATFVVYGEGGASLYNDKYLNSHGKNINDVLGINKGYLPVLQEINPGAKQLALIKGMIKQNIKIGKELFKWCSEYSVGHKESILYPLNFMTPYKLMQYATDYFSKHKKANYYSSGEYYSMSDLLSDYKDYLHMSNALNFDMKNDFILYPKSLKEAHDRVNDLTQIEIAEAYNKKIADDFNKLQNRYHFKRNGLFVTAPKSAADLTEEGHILHHCVGGYIKDVVKEKTTILFIRKVKAPEEPFCTVEVKNGDIVQTRIRNNDNPPPKTQKFINQWKKEVLYAHSNAA